MRADHVPLIDLAALRHDSDWQRVDSICREVGFLVIEGHGVADDLVQQMHRMAVAFFAQTPEAKRRATAPDNKDTGYSGPEASYLGRTGDAAVEAAAAHDLPAHDLKESFGIGPPHAPPDLSPQERRYFRDIVWPEQPPGLPPVFIAYYQAMEALAARLMAVFARALDLPPQFFANALDRQISSMFVHHYPGQPTPPAPGQLRAGAHTDFGSLTILHPGDNPGGLQVCDRAGLWHDVMPPPHAFVVNLGDLMAQWTNDRWVSTLHRVLNPPPERAHLPRQSITFFHQPNWHAEIACLPGCATADNPPRYQPETSGAHYEKKNARVRGEAAAARA